MPSTAKDISARNLAVPKYLALAGWSLRFWNWSWPGSAANAPIWANYHCLIKSTSTITACQRGTGIIESGKSWLRVSNATVREKKQW